MKKSTKLLSVILAIIMIFSSMSVLASAAKANYKTVADLNANKAYSPYGTVTRLTTEERLSMVFDYLDSVLETTNIKGGMDLSILGSLSYDVTSVNGILGTVDSVKNLLSKNAGLLVTLKDAYTLNQNFDVWQSGMTREGSPQLAIVKELLELLQNNANVLFNILNRGSLNLGALGNGIIGAFMDMGSFNKILGDLPGLIRGMIYPMFTRWDDTTDRADQLAATATLADANENKARNMEATLNDFVQRLFKNDMSITTYVENAAGECVSDHSLPMETGKRWHFTRGTSSEGEYLQLSSYDTEKKAYVSEEANRYYKTLEEQAEDYTGPDRYVYTKTNEDGSKENLKYYKNNSQFLPSFAAAMAAGTASIDLTTETPAQLFYKFIPYVFNEMAPVVLNGSVKKLFAGLLGAKFTYIGEVGSAEVKALPDASDVFFTQPQGEYLWEWSDYKVIKGNHYYRFEDQIYAGDINDVTKYFSRINWDWKVENGAIDEFVPTFDAQGNLVNSPAGYSTVFQALNDFVAKVIDIAATPELKTLMGWQKGDNSKLVDNIKRAARALLPIEPEIIFGSNYADSDKYYDLIMTATDNQEILAGVACTLLDFLMPQLILPTADNIKGKGVKLGAIFAAVIRELATQFLPTYNYDELIYADYNNKTFVADKDNEYWLDVCLTMGVDIGMSYLRNLADLGEDDATDGYHFAASKTYKLASFDQTGWEDTVDWIIDWALSDKHEWCWSMGKIVDTFDKPDLATAQDPWSKLGDILGTLLPLDQIVNVNTSEADWLKTALRENLVMGILDLDLTKITGATEANGLFNVPSNSILRSTPTMKAVVIVVRDILNGILNKVANGDLIPASYSEKIKETGVIGSTTTYTGEFQNLDDLFKQQNLAYLVRQLLIKLYTAVGGDNYKYTTDASTLTNNGLLDVLLPFANFFIGWTTDAQKMKNPTMLYKNLDDRNYLYTNSDTVSTSLRVRNDVSGMLLKHRASATTNALADDAQADHSYDIIITDIKADDGTQLNIKTGLPLTVQPGTAGQIDFDLPYTGNRPITFTITYSYVGKGGQPLGGTQYMSSYQYISNETPDTELTTAGEELTKGDVHMSSPTTRNILTFKSIKEVNNLAFGFNNLGKKGLFSTSYYAIWVKSSIANGVPAMINFDQSYVHGANENATLQAEGIGHTNEDRQGVDIIPYKFNDEAYKEADYSIPGETVVDLGTFTINWVNNRNANSKTGVTFTINPGDIYIVNTDSLKDTFDRYRSVMKAQFPSATDTQWTAMKTALSNAQALLLKPFKTASYADYKMDNVNALIKAIEDAYADLQKSNASASASGVADIPAILTDTLKTAEPGTDIPAIGYKGDATPEVNYQDYELYEYFVYQDTRTEVRNRIDAYVGPVAPENRIEGSSLSAAEIADVIANAPGKKAFAIQNTVEKPTDKEIADYEKSAREWQAPSYVELDNQASARLLTYYKQFLLKKNTVKDFLKKEIDYANNKGYVEANYSADSWAAYKAAYDNAVAVNNNNNALQSQVFDAKYELMKAQNELLRKDRSVKELGLLEDLKALVAQAEIIFNNSQYYAQKANITEADAYGALIKALGYTYTDEDGNEQILYSRSAAEFLKYDRENTATNLARIEASKVALKAAIDNFDCTVKLVENDGDTTTAVAQGVKIINGITPGSIASIDALMNHVKASAENAVATPTASASGFFGTGAKVDLSIEGIGVLTTYYVVIYGDVNGDGAIDAFDAAIVNQNINTGAKLSGVYKDAAMVTNGDDVELADYSAIFNAAVGAQEIEQNRA